MPTLAQLYGAPKTPVPSPLTDFERIAGTIPEPEPFVPKALPPVNPGLIGMTGRALGGGLGAVGNILDLPGSSVRDVLALKNPFDQWADPLGYNAQDNRTGGRELLRQYGAVGDKDTWGNFGAGFAVDMLTDPLNAVTLGGATAAGKIAKKAGLDKLARGTANDMALETAKGLAGPTQTARMTRTMRGMGSRTRITPNDIINAQTDPAKKAELLQAWTDAGGTDDLLNKPLQNIASFKIPGLMPKAKEFQVEDTSKAMEDWAKKNSEFIDSNDLPDDLAGGAGDTSPKTPTPDTPQDTQQVTPQDATTEITGTATPEVTPAPVGFSIQRNAKGAIDYKKTNDVFRSISEQHSAFDDNLKAYEKAGSLDKEDSLLIQSIYADSDLDFAKGIVPSTNADKFAAGTVSNLGTGYKLNLVPKSKVTLATPTVNTLNHELGHIAFRELGKADPELFAAAQREVLESINDGSLLKKFSISEGDAVGNAKIGPKMRADVKMSEYFQNNPEEVFAQLFAHSMTSKIPGKEIVGGGAVTKLLQSAWEKVKKYIAKVTSSATPNDPRLNAIEKLMDHAGGFASAADRDEILGGLNALKAGDSVQPLGKYFTEAGAVMTGKTLLGRAVERLGLVPGDMDEAAVKALKVDQESDGKYRIKLDEDWLKKNFAPVSVDPVDAGKVVDPLNPAFTNLRGNPAANLNARLKQPQSLTADDVAAAFEGTSPAEHGDLLNFVKTVRPDLAKVAQTSMDDIANTAGRGGVAGADDVESIRSMGLRDQQQRSPEFKQWFGDWEANPSSASKVVDESGKPMVVYHGTRHSGLSVDNAVQYNKNVLEARKKFDEWQNKWQQPKQKAMADIKAAEAALPSVVSKKLEDIIPDKSTRDHVATTIRYSDNLDDALAKRGIYWSRYYQQEVSPQVLREAFTRTRDDFYKISQLRKELDSIPDRPSLGGTSPHDTKLRDESPKFRTGASGENDGGYLSAGSYFTKDPELASNYATNVTGSGVVPVYLNIQKPFIHGVTKDSQVDKLTNELLEQYNQTTRRSGGDVDEYSRNVAVARRDALIQLGYDGEIYDRDVASAAGAENKSLANSEIVAFHPNQIKSAIGNSGAFSKENDSILESLIPKEATKKAAERLVAKWKASVPEDAASAVADFVDRGGDLFYASAAGRASAAVFNADLFGATNTEISRKLGRDKAEAMREKDIFYRQAIDPIMRQLSDAGQFDIDTLVRTGKSPEEATSHVNKMANSLVRYMEGVGKIDPAVDSPEMRAAFDVLKKLKDDAWAEVDDAGLEAPILQDLFAKHFPRNKVDPGKSSIRINPRSGPLVDLATKSSRQREGLFRDLPGGTAVINEISVDPVVSGIKHRADFIKKKLSDDELVTQQIEYQGQPMSLREYMAAKYGERLVPKAALKNFDPEKSTLFDQWIQTAANFDPKYADEQTQIFGHNPLADVSNYLSDAYRASSLARTTQQLIGKAARLSAHATSDVQLHQIADLMPKLGFKNEGKALVRVANELPDAEKAAFGQAVDSDVADLTDALLNGDEVKRIVDGKEYFIKAKDIDNGNLKNVEVRYADKKRVEQKDGSIKEILTTADDATPELIDLAADPNYLRKMSEQVTAKNFLKNFGVEDDIFKDAQAHMKPFSNPEEYGVFERGLRRFINIMKAGLTAPWPAFHMRNFVSGQVTNAMLGATDPRFSTFDPKARKFFQPIKDAYDMRNNQAFDGIRDIKGLDAKGADGNFLLSPTEALEKLKSEAFAMGVIGEKQGLAAEYIGDDLSSLTSQMPGMRAEVNPLKGKFSPAPPERTWKDLFNPLATRDGYSINGTLKKPEIETVRRDLFGGATIGKDVSSFVEDLNRLAPYIALRRQGYSARAARDAVNKMQIDYTRLSAVESRKLRLLIPFYSYSKGMLPVTLEELITNPGGPMATTIKLANRSRNPDEIVPDHIANTVGVPMGETSDGSKRYLTGFGLGFEDSLNLLNGPLRMDPMESIREVLGRSNPVVKGTGELAFGRSLFQDGPGGGRELADMDPPVGRTLSNIHDLVTGDRTKKAEPFIHPMVEFAVSNSPASRFASTARTLTDPRKWEKPVTGLGLNLLTGARVNDVSPQAQDSIYMERLGRELKDMGGREFRRPYISDDQQAKMSPEEQAKGKAILDEINNVTKRFKTRRENKDDAATKLKDAIESGR